LSFNYGFQVIRTVEAGGVFGESCVLINKPQQFTVRTREREMNELLKLDRVTLLSILHGRADDASIIMNNHVKVCMI
jgi:CRP-like cAMP-binding protein